MRPLQSVRSRRRSLVTLLAAMPIVLVGCAESREAVTPRAPMAPQTTDEIAEIGCSTTAPVRRAPPEFDDADPSAVRLFFDVLAAYGAWSEDGRLGLVWSPSHQEVGDVFVPYATHGRWTHRSFDANNGDPPIDEYVWVSDLAWGWVTFHYGRWTYAGDRGWSWIPGRKYAGAWVDWRTPEVGKEADAVVGWGPMPPSQLWRVSPGPASSRVHASGRLDVREARLVAVPYVAFATPYAYTRAKDLFAADLGAHLLYGPAALAVAHHTQPSAAPSPSQLGLHDVPAPPALDRGLQQAWMLATPATAIAVGAGPELGAPPRLRTYVTGGPHFASAR